MKLLRTVSCVSSGRRPFVAVLSSLCLGLTLLYALMPPTTAAQEWIHLFNGKDLDGWRVESTPKDRGKVFWKVVDGAIECDSLGRTDHDYVWLVTEREFGDFELKVQFQAFRESPGNSGIQVRSRFDGSPDAISGGWMDGPQVDIHPPDPWRTGLIYDETREERRWIHPSLPDWNIDRAQGPEKVVFFFAEQEPGWNDLRIICDGLRIQTYLNGLRVADFDGSGILDSESHLRRRVGLSGHIALQLHSRDELKIRFRDLRLRPLAGSTVPD
jgi:hypothetical protein